MKSKIAVIFLVFILTIYFLQDKRIESKNNQVLFVKDERIKHEIEHSENKLLEKNEQKLGPENAISNENVNENKTKDQNEDLDEDKNVLVEETFKSTQSKEKTTTHSLNQEESQIETAEKHVLKEDDKTRIVVDKKLEKLLTDIDGEYSGNVTIIDQEYIKNFGIKKFNGALIINSSNIENHEVNSEIILMKDETEVPALRLSFSGDSINQNISLLGSKKFSITSIELGHKFELIVSLTSKKIEGTYLLRAEPTKEWKVIGEVKFHKSIVK